MGQKDLWQSDYFDSNARFADAYNGNHASHPRTSIRCLEDYG